MKKIFAGVVLMLSFGLYAQEEVKQPKWEISGGTSSSLSFVGIGQNRTTSFVFNVGADYFVAKNVAVGIIIQTGIASMLKTVAFLPDVVFNIRLADQDIRNAFFIGIGAGVVYATSDNGAGVHASDSTFVGAIEIGKRFKLSESICYTPNISTFFYASPSSASLDVNPVAFSLFL